jgi:histidine-containing phosphotransfer protein
MFVEDSNAKLSKLEEALSSPKPDGAELDGVVHQFKGSSSSIGASRVTAACVDFRAAAQAEDVDAMRKHLEAMRTEFAAVSATLAEIVELETQIKAAGAAA